MLNIYIYGPDVSRSCGQSQPTLTLRVDVGGWYEPLAKDPGPKLAVLHASLGQCQNLVTNIIGPMLASALSSNIGPMLAALLAASFGRC